MSTLPTSAKERKSIPLVTGVLDYFPNALIGVAQCSLAGNEQHQPGEPLHWARGKSSDHADALNRHMIERNEVDTDGIPHVFKVAWRALALAEEYCEAHGAKPGMGSKFPDAPKESSQPLYRVISCKHTSSAFGWVPEMERMIGKTYEASFVDSDYAELVDDMGRAWDFKLNDLQLVKDA